MRNTFVGADSSLPAAPVPFSALTTAGWRPAALPPDQPQARSLALCAIQTLLQQFVISQEYFRPIFLFLISLIDFLNYVSAQGV